MVRLVSTFAIHCHVIGPGVDVCSSPTEGVFKVNCSSPLHPKVYSSRGVVDYDDAPVLQSVDIFKLKADSSHDCILLCVSLFWREPSIIMSSIELYLRSRECIAQL